LQQIFGSVLAVSSFDREADAVAEANAGEYGRAAAVLCRDRARAQRIADNLLPETVWINCPGPVLVEGPWRDFNDSGIGRELGRWRPDSYAEPQQLTSSLGPALHGWYLRC
jgi:betaine-aldehyde dehydrogenase